MAENEASRAVEPEADPAEPLIDGIPEAYFRAFVGKNADYYIEKFRRFGEINNDNNASMFSKIFLYINLNYSVLFLSFIFGPFWMCFYRKAYHCAFKLFAMFIVLQMLFSQFFVLIYCLIAYFLLSLFFNFFYYKHVKSKIVYLLSEKEKENIINMLNVNGGTSIHFAITFFIFYEFFFVFLFIVEGISSRYYRF
jgi:hypothetical protein